jgi:diguanylate cyclase (GGDEF)-like protein
MLPRPNHVLVATLNVKRAATYRTLLLELGYDVHVARDGEEAQQLAARYGAPLLLITDVSLPKLDGLMLIRHLRREAPKDRLGVIVVSAHEPLRATARQLADSLGIARILPADADRVALRDAIQAARPDLAAALSRPAPAEVAAHPAGGRAEDALDLAALEAARRFKVPICIAYAKLENREHLAAHFTATDPSNALIEPPAMAILRQIAAAGEPLIVPDVETNAIEREFGFGKPNGIRGFAGMPLGFERAEGSGTLCLLDTRPLALDAADLDHLATFAHDLGRLVERRTEATAAQPPARAELTAEEFEALERLAVTDPLTGLSNRRGGEQAIASEIARAKRQRTPLSCIVLDIDRFKEINDTYGHQGGDQVLREISALLRRTVRAYDILVRWGGEEFLIVLPGVDLDQARRLAERVRHAVEVLESKGIGRITISAGAAALESDYDFDSMLALADRRLYQAKTSGRNRVA